MRQRLLVVMPYLSHGIQNSGNARGLAWFARPKILGPASHVPHRPERGPQPYQTIGVNGTGAVSVFGLDQSPPISVSFFSSTE